MHYGPYLELEKKTAPSFGAVWYVLYFTRSRRLFLFLNPAYRKQITQLSR